MPFNKTLTTDSGIAIARTRKSDITLSTPQRWQYSPNARFYVVNTTFDKIDVIAKIVPEHRVAALDQFMTCILSFPECIGAHAKPVDHRGLEINDGIAVNIGALPLIYANWTLYLSWPGRCLQSRIRKLPEVIWKLCQP